ncbi:MAG: hypothetical protein IPN76_31715 [Saprospiraceae bacterium]|nr:hypothetical protein [Saprospiraceae bacterium]
MRITIFSICLLITGQIASQPVQINTNAIAGWTTATTAFCNVTPRTPAQLNALTFNNTVGIVNTGCPNPPGFTVPSPGPNAGTVVGAISRNGTCNAPANATVFYRFIANLNFVPCKINYNIKADDYFRIYVNGVSIINGALGGDCSNQWDGNTWAAIYRGFIANNGTFVQGNNTVIIEVNNTGAFTPNNPHYLAALINFWPTPSNNLNLPFAPPVFTSPSNVQLTYSSVSGATPPDTRTITIETSTVSQNGPWSPLSTQVIPVTIAAFMANLPLAAVINIPVENCKFYKITSTLNYGSCQNSNSAVFYWCPGGLKGDPASEKLFSSTDDNFKFTPSASFYEDNIYDEHVYNDVLNSDSTSLGNGIVQFKNTPANLTFGNSIMVYPNPAKDEVNLILPFEETAPVSIWNSFGQLVFSIPNVPGKTPFTIATYKLGEWHIFHKASTASGELLTKRLLISR